MPSRDVSRTGADAVPRSELVNTTALGAFDDVLPDDADRSSQGSVEFVDEAAALAKELLEHQQLMDRIDELWGPEPAYTPGAEDAANYFQQLYYGWIGDFIYKAAGGTITEKDLPQPVQPNRAYNSGKRLSRQVHDDLRNARRWDPYIGCEVTYKGEPETHGWLRWVGCLQQSNFPRSRLAGVEWTVAPRHRRVCSDAAAAAEGPLLHDGIVHGARLFYPRLAGKGKRCSCEPVKSVELLPRQSPVPPPPAPVTADVLWSLVKAHKYHLLVQIPPKLITDICGLFVPVLLGFFVDYLGSANTSWGVGMAIVIGVFVTSVLQSCSSHKYDHMSIRAAAVFETSATGVLFEKCMTVARKSLLLPEMSVGRVMNIASSDIDNIGDLNWYVMYFWSAPFQLVVCIILLYRLVGFCAFPSLAVLAVILPVQAVLSKWQQEIRERMASVVDQRIRRTNELLSGIRIVKFMGWEPRFLSFIERARNVELAYLKRVQVSYVAFMFVDSATPILVISTVLVFCHLTGVVLTPQVVFPTIALLNTLRVPFFMIPVILSAILQCLVSSRRITTFLECDDNTTASVKDIAELYKSGASAVYNDATVHTFIPVGLPKARSRTKGMVRRALLWFKKRTVPEQEWGVLGDDGQIDSDPAAEERANVLSDKRLRHQKQHKIPQFTPVSTPDSSISDKQDQSDKNDAQGGTPTQTNIGDEDDGVVEEIHQLAAKDLLQNINVIFPQGKLTVVVGATGSGKSTLLGTLLGEYYLTSGSLWASKSIAYVPQQPWIMNATLRNNILFFDKEVPEKLKSVIECCQLETDLKVLVSGLETEIGEKGINLSGGQKARVSLARAVYADREMYLLDDPLSALDAHVGVKIFHDLLRGKLSQKTRVLATHQLHLLPFADHVVAVRQGRVAFSGDYASYVASGLGHALEEDLRKEVKHADTASADERDDVAECDVTEACEAVSATAVNADGVVGEPGETAENDGTARGLPVAAPGDEEEGKLMTTEEKAIGSVPWSTYLAYIRACGGYAAWGILAAVFAFTEVINVANGVWLSIWSTRTFDLHPTTYVLWYLFIVLLNMFVSPIRSYLCYDYMRTGSRNMHHSLLLSVGVATMDFFDRTPLGRVLNRFTKDIDILDNTLNDSYLYLFQYLLSMISTVAVMTVAQPFVILAIIPCGFIYFKLMKVYNASNRETRRIKSIAHSPVFTLLEESVNGQSTISVYGKEHVILREAMGRLDTVYSALYMQNIANRWLGVRLEFISCLIVTSVAFFGVLGKQLHFSTQSIGLISLSLTTSLTLTETLNWLVRQVATVEANMNCVERILHYVNAIDHEEMPEMSALVDDMVAATTKNGSEECVESDDVTVIPSASPTIVAPHVVKAGSLEFRDVQMRYREGLPLVLRDVSFTIAPREKVGIVGRTGSGKSTLLLTFMRMVDICGGEIVVSGQPIRSYPLRQLRKQFSMIPQDPVLFDGTVRLNVDPFLEASSAEVWDALELVGLRERIASEPEGIDGRVLEGGSNFSVGQRQLLCMARALLKKGSGFILMDEATANIDQSLDRHIQGTVMSAFSAYTVITIAHRLQTVAQYDKIIVMDHGVVAEMGSPRELASRSGSLFRSMIEALGPDAAESMLANASAQK